MAVRVFGLIKRREDLTHEEFIEYWGKHHAQIITSLDAVKRNIVRYTQFHVLPQESSALAAAGFPIAQYDGMTEMVAEKVEDFQEMMTDEGYLKIAYPDEGKFLDRTSMTVLVVEAHVKLERS